MDEDRPNYSMRAPAADTSAPSMRLPGFGERFPAVDDHLVEPEVTRNEMVNGRKMEASPAKAAHATLHSRLDYVISAHVSSGYIGACDLLTRHGHKSDFASDTAVFKKGVDPKTGSRYLEEIAFEVVGEQSRKDVKEKASLMIGRGVRRVFAIFVKQGTVEEWSKAERDFIPLPSGAALEDDCWVRPINAVGLLDAARADREVARALIAKKNDVIMDFGSVREAKGKAEGKAESIVDILALRGLTISEPLREDILSCKDLPTLDRWLERVLVVTRAEEILEA